MSSGSHVAFHRLFRKRELLRGRSLLAAGWSLIGSLALCLMLICGLLIADLLATGGALEIDRGRPGLAEKIEAISGGALSAGGKQLETMAPQAQFADSGIFPTVWWSRDSLIGLPLAALWRGIPSLQSNWPALLTLTIVAIVAGLLRSFCLWRARIQAERLALQTVTRLRRSLHRQALRLGPSDLLDQQGDHVLGLFTKQVERVRAALALYVYRLGRYPIKLVLLLILAILVSWTDFLICVVPLAICWYLAHRARIQRIEADRLSNDQARSELRVLAEELRKTRMVRGYGMEEFEREQFEAHLRRFQTGASRASGGANLLQAFGRSLLILCVTTLAFLLGSRVLGAAQGALEARPAAWQLSPANLSFAAALLLAGIFACMYRPIERLWSLRRELPEAERAAATIYRYLDRSPEVAQAVGAQFLQPVSTMIRFDNVSYSIRGGRKLLDGLDLQIPAGDFVAIVSIDPLEAKALVNLLPRFIEPQQGRVLYDNVDIAWATLESLRAETVVVSAEAGLTGTVRDAIACGRDSVTFQQVTDAAKKAHAHNFIQRLPQGYETVLGEHGEVLDSGQAFRLALARAAQVDATVMIVEEPPRRFDEDTKNLIDDAYQRIFAGAGKTVIVLPSRLSTVKKVDRVIVLHEGRVDAVGRHADLVRGSSLYRHWEYSRFNEFQTAETSPAAGHHDGRALLT